MASAYLSQTISSSTGKKFTLSMWVKRTEPGGSNMLFHLSSDSGSTNYLDFAIKNNDKLDVQLRNGSGTTYYRKRTNRVFRDTSAWYHLVWRFDSTNSTADDRWIMYVNGERVTDIDLDGTPSQVSSDYVTPLNRNGATLQIGTNIGGSLYFEGCLSHVHFCDGYSYGADSFGSTDATTGEWKINTSPSVSYGTNGFLILKDGNTITDQSSNSNDFTSNGAGVTKTEDNPSNVFAVMNKLNTENGGSTLSFGNTKLVTTAQGGGPYTGRTIATLGATSGKYYWEVKALTDPQNTYPVVAIVGEDFSVSDSSAYLTGNNANSKTYITYKIQNGNVEYNFAGSRQGGSYGSSGSTNDIIGVALDLDNGKVFFSRNGTWGNSGDPANGTNPASSSVGSLTGNFVFPAFGDENYSSSATLEVNFGNGYFGTTAVSSAGTNASNNGIFEYDVPTGFTALSTKGLNE